MRKTGKSLAQLSDGKSVFLGQVIEFAEHRAVAALQFLVELPHHLPAPVVALDEAFALVVGGVATERAGDVGAGRAVVVLDQRVDLEALEVRELEHEGAIGKLHETVYSTTGVATTLAHSERMGREIAAKLRAARVDAVILTST